MVAPARAGNQLVERSASGGVEPRRRRHNKRVLVGILAAAGCAAVGVIFFRSQTGAEVIEGGPLDSGSFRGGASFIADVHHPLTFADVRLVNRGNNPAVLDRIELLQTRGTIRLAGALVGVVQEVGWVGAGDADFPPKLKRMVLKQGALGPLSPLEGYVLRQTRWRGEPTSKGGALLLMLGVEVTEPGISLYRGLRLSYHVGDRDYARTIPFALAACAPYAYYDARRDQCEPPLAIKG